MDGQIRLAPPEAVHREIQRAVIKRVAAMTRLDANDSAFLEREMTQLRAALFRVLYPELKARTMLPKAADIAASAPAYSIKIMEPVGATKFIDVKSHDLPRFDVVVREELGKVRSVGGVYGWDINELREAARTQTPLAQWKAETAREGIERGIDEVIAFGGFRKADGTVPDVGLQGFLNNEAVIDLGIASGSYFASQTGREIVTELGSYIATIQQQSNQLFRATNFVMPVRDFTYLENTPYSEQIGDSILTILRRNNPGVEFEAWYLANGAGAGGLGRGVVYQKDPKTCESVIPQEFEQMPPELKDLEYQVACHARVGGVSMHQPLAFKYVDFANS